MIAGPVAVSVGLDKNLAPSIGFVQRLPLPPLFRLSSGDQRVSVHGDQHFWRLYMFRVKQAFWQFGGANPDQGIGLLSIELNRITNEIIYTIHTLLYDFNMKDSILRNTNAHTYKFINA